MAETGVSAGSDLRTVFVSSSLGTHMVMNISDDDTVDDFKRKVVVEHSRCFPHEGNIEIHTIKVQRKSIFYHISNSVLVRNAFNGFSGAWFLYVDATSTSLTRNQEESLEDLEDHLKQPRHNPVSAELEPRNYGSSLNHVTADNLLLPADSSMIYPGNSSLQAPVPLKESVNNIQLTHSSNQFDIDKSGEPSKVLEHKSRKSDHDTGAQEPATPSGNDISDKDLGANGLETRDDLAVSLKKIKRSRNVQAGDPSSEILLEEPSKKKQKEMEIEVAYSNFPKDPVEECDAMDKETLPSNGETLKTLTDGENATADTVSELVSRHLNDDQSAEPNLIDNKKKKKKKHVKPQSGVRLSKASSAQNVAPAEEVPSGPAKQNAVPALELEGGPNLYNDESSFVAMSAKVVGDVLRDKNEDGVLGVKVGSQGHDAFETADKKSKKRRKHRSATDKSVASHLSEETNKEGVSNKNDNEIIATEESNAVGNENLSSKNKQFDLNEVHMNDQDGNNLNNASVIEEAVANVFADLSTGQNEDRNLGIEVGNRGDSILEMKEKKSRKSKKYQASSGKHGSLQLVDDVNKADVGMKLIPGSLNISNQEEVASVNGANASKEKVLDLNEAEMNSHDQNDTKRSAEAQVIIQDGDWKGKRKTKVKAKKTRHAVGKRDISGEGDIDDKFEDRVLDADTHGNAIEAVDNGLSFIENSEVSESDKLTKIDTHKGSESEVKSTKLNSIIEENLQPENERGRRKSKKSRASNDRAPSEMSEENHDIHRIDDKKEERSSSTNAKKSKSSKVTLQSHLSEPALDADRVLEKHDSAGNYMGDPKKRKKSSSEKAKLKTHSSDSDLEKDMGIRADTSLMNSEPGNDFIEFREAFSAKGQNHEALEPREDFQAKGAHVGKEHQDKSDEPIKRLSGYSESTVVVLTSANNSDHLKLKKPSVIAREKIEASSEAGQAILAVKNTSPEETSIDPAESSDNNIEGINGTIYTNGKGKRALSKSDRYCVAVRKPLDNKLGEVLNASDQKKGSVANDESIFQQNASESSEDGDEANYSDATTQNVSDDSYASDFSGRGDETPRSAIRENIMSPKNGMSEDRKNKETSGDEIILSQSTATKKSLDAILRSSRRYKKAKLTASQTLLEDEESQRFELTPDSQPDHNSPVTLSKP